MNRTPTSIGVRSFMEGLEQMDVFPVLPDSAVVSRDDRDVFVSFHWEFDSLLVAKYSSVKLAEWLRKALHDMGAGTVEEVDGGLDE